MHEVVDDRRELQRGTLAGLAAYTLWGVFPLVFRLLQSVAPVEILLHRIVWSFVVVVALVALRRRGAEVVAVLTDGRRAVRAVLAAALISTNWLVYIWAVNNDHVVEAALGYYVNPLLTVALGVVVLREHLRRAQRVALVLAATAVLVLTFAYGRVPWIALTLAASFAGYGYLKKSVGVGAAESLAVETAVLVPVAGTALVVLGLRGDAAFLAGDPWRDVGLVGLGVVTAVPLLLFGTAASRIPLSLLGLLQYLTPTMQFLLGVVVFGEALPPERLVGFVLVWTALAVLATDAVRTGRARRALDRDDPHPTPEPA